MSLESCSSFSKDIDLYNDLAALNAQDHVSDNGRALLSLGPATTSAIVLAKSYIDHHF